MIYHITLIRAENGWYSDMGDAKLVGHNLEVVLGIIQRRIEEEVKKRDNPANHFVLTDADVDEAELTDRGGRS